MTSKEKANGKNGQTSEAELKKLRTHIEDVSGSIAKHKTALTTIPGDAKHVAIRVMQQDLIDKLGEELQRSQTRLKNLEDTIAKAEKEAAEGALAKSRQAEIDFLKEHPPVCTECGYLGTLVETIRQPTLVAGRSLGDPGARYCLDFLCTNDSLTHGRHRFRVWLPKEANK